MVDVRRTGPGGPGSSPDEVAGRTFGIVRRGFDPAAVRSFLSAVADELRAAARRETDLRSLLAGAEDRAAHPRIDESMLTAALGEETARILRSAREAAQDTRQKADENVAQLLREAHEQAAAIRADAELVMAREIGAAEEAGSRTKGAAEETAAKIKESAEGEAAAALGRARREAEALLHDVQAEARSMLEEAQAVRARVLGDLSRRRKLAHAQVEQLRAGRDRLLVAYRLVRSTLDEVTDELTRSEAEAREAAEAAARRLAAGPEETGEDVEAGLEPAAGAAAPELAPPASAEPEGGAPSHAAVRPPEPTLIVSTPVGAGPPAAPSDEEQEEAPAAERRMSSLRILRSWRHAGPSSDEPATDEVAAVDEAPGEAAAAPVEPEAERQAGAAVEAAPHAAAVDEAAAPPGEAAALPEPESTAPGEVGALFARIRADREAALASARAVLADEAAAEHASHEPESSAPEQPEPEQPESEAAVEVVGDEVVGDEDEALLQRRDDVVEPIAAQLARRLKRALQDDQNAVLDRLRVQRGRPAPEAVLPLEDEQLAQYRNVALGLLEEAAEAGARFAGAEGVVAAVGELADGLAADLAGALRRRLERGLQEGVDEEHGQLVDRVGAAFREQKTQRVERLATDHVIAAFSRAIVTGVDDGRLVRWVVDDEGGPCADCDDNALAGPTPAGQTFPTGQQHPPAHAGCRCLLAPETT